ncbi:transposase [Gluconobacter sphaericus]|uniref:transposase n=1 Tax=Gluconobacter sphaericus TaxID=574987 RepID=UPI0035A2529E
MVVPMVLDAPITGHSSQSYVDCVVIPDLRPGDIVIMENLGFHKGPGVQAAIEAADADCALFHALQPKLPPIEKAFFELKAHPRKNRRTYTRYLVRQDQHTDRSDLT